MSEWREKWREFDRDYEREFPPMPRVERALRTLFGVFLAVLWIGLAVVFSAMTGGQ